MNATTKKRESSLNIRQIATIGVMAAAICLLAPLSIPIGSVPISLTNLVIYFSLYILGMKKGTLSYLIYLLLGIVGLPVFSGFTSGPGKLFGPTGGYLIGFIPMAILAGIVIDKYTDKKILCLLAMIVGTAICYAFGTIWLAYQAHMNFISAMWAGVIPFILGDLIKIALAILLGPQIRERLIQANLYD